MIQHATPLLLVTCGRDHRPQLVETRGTPRGAPIHFGPRTTWHVECPTCALATVPAFTREAALLRWCTPQLWGSLIPQDQLARARLGALTALTNAA